MAHEVPPRPRYAHDIAPCASLVRDRFPCFSRCLATLSNISWRVTTPPPSPSPPPAPPPPSRHPLLYAAPTEPSRTALDPPPTPAWPPWSSTRASPYGRRPR